MEKKDNFVHVLPHSEASFIIRSSHKYHIDNPWILPTKGQ